MKMKMKMKMKKYTINETLEPRGANVYNFKLYDGDYKSFTGYFTLADAKEFAKELDALKIVYSISEWKEGSNYSVRDDITL